jgi:hypothetical protein
MKHGRGIRMNSIKFSHRYFKMPPAHMKTARLLQVLIADKKELSPEFVEYDTAYKEIECNPEEETKHYPLPDGKLIILLLQTGWVWTTIRRWTPAKESYYRSLQGQELKIEMIEDKG